MIPPKRYFLATFKNPLWWRFFAHLVPWIPVVIVMAPFRLLGKALDLMARSLERSFYSADYWLGKALSTSGLKKAEREWKKSVREIYAKHPEGKP